jgi:FixJ family two-component response regulator
LNIAPKGNRFAHSDNFADAGAEYGFRSMVAHRSHIAIIDDDSAMRQAIGRLCGAAAIPNRCYSSAEEFLLTDLPEDVYFLVLDVQLPGLSGFELHHQMQERGIRLPVVFITGQDQPLYREKAFRAGAAAYLIKPFAAEDLIAALRGGLQGCYAPQSADQKPLIQPTTP